MKFQVNVKTLTGDIVNFDLVASADDTVQDIKERIALAEPNPFPDQILSLNGKALQDGTKLSSCGIADGGAFDFQAQASEEALAQQFDKLLRSKGSLSVEELGLLYSLQYGVTAGDALQALGGKNVLLKGFLEKCGKQFVLEGSQVKSAAPSEQPVQPVVSKVLGDIPEDVAVQNLTISVSVRVELPAAVREEEVSNLRVQSADTVSSVKQRVADAVLVPFADRELMLEGKVLDDSCRLVDCGVKDASRLSFVIRGSEATFVAQLAALLQAKGPASRMELDNMYCCRHGTSATQALQMLGWGEKLGGFLQRQPQFFVKGSCVALAQASPAWGQSPRGDNGRLLDLDAKLNSEGFAETASQELDRLAETLASQSFLNVQRVEKGGSVATGTAIPGAAGAVIVLFLEGLTLACHASWLPSLAQSVAGTLQERFVGQGGVSKVSAAEGVVTITTDGPLKEVQVLFSPAFGSYSEALQGLKGQNSPTARALGKAASVAQKVRFVEKQPDGAKATMRLLKWWREQRAWSSKKSRPTDELLELVVAHSVVANPPRDLQAAVSNSLALLGRFDQLAVSWPLSMRSYREEFVSKALSEQRPLLLDSANPCANLAAPEVFQPAELMSFARRTSAGGCLSLFA